MTLLDDVRLGSQEPTALHLPVGVESAEADDAVEWCREAGISLDPWQELVLRRSLMENGNRWAAREVGVVVCRQVGKGRILEARQALGLFFLKEQLGIHTAHEFKTCYEHFRRVVDLVESNDELRSQVRIIRTGAGDQAIELINGSRLRFLARSRSSGRGFSGDVVYLDEAFRLSDETFGALLPTLSARPNPQIWLTSSAPHSDSQVLHRLRKRALEGNESRLLWCAWENDADTDPQDVDAWYRVNPGLGIRIAEEDVASEQRSMAPSEFARERLGVPEPPEDESHSSPVPLDRWADLVDGDSMAVDASVRLALDVPPDRMTASFAVAGKRADNLLHGSLRFFVPPADMRNLVATAKALSEGHGTPLILPPNSPAKAWKAELVAAGVELDELSPAEYAEACGAIQAAVIDGRLRHRGQPELSSAVAGLSSRASGDVETWSRRSSSSNISPFVALTCALVRVPEKVEIERVPMVAFT